MGNAKTKLRTRRSPFAPEVKDEAEVAESVAGWNTLHPNYIDKIADALKRNGRWTLDGASLRALNRHWRRHMDLQVHRIDPHLSRSLSPRDFRSLARFENISTLSLGTFPFRCEVSEDEVVSVLEKLPNLRCLELLVCEEALRFLKADNIENLRSVKKIMIDNRKFLDRHVEYFQQMRRFPALEEVFIGGQVKVLGEILDEIPSVKRLSILSMRKKIQDPVIAKLRRLDELKIGYHWRQPFNAGRLSCIAALEINVDGPHVNWLQNLTQLTSLRLNLLPQAAEAVNSPTFVETLKTLKSLAISSSHPQNLTLNLQEEYPLLKELALHGFRFYGTQLKKNLTHATKLKFKHCLMEEVEVLKQGMYKVETLYLQDCWDSHYKDMSLFWEPEDAPNLKAIYTEVSVVQSQKQMDFLSRLSCVEHLMLEFMHPHPHGSVMTVDGLNRLTELKNLRKLGFLGLYRWPNLLDSLPLDFLKKLEVFGVGRYDPQFDREEWINPLRQTHSRLKFNENGRMFHDLEEFDPSFF